MRLRKRSTIVPSSRWYDQPAAHQQRRRESLFDKTRFEAFAAGRGVADAEHLERLLGDPSLLELSPRAGACRGAELLAEPRGRHVVRFQQRLAVPVRFRVFLAVFPLRDGQPESRRQLPHCLRERHFFVQLDELDHVTADAAAEALEVALVAVHVERRRLLAMERAQAFVRGSCPAERDALLHHLHDVGVRFQVVDERGREKRHYSFNSTIVAPPAPWFSGAGP